MSPTTLRVLISGAGIGGPVAAYWLAKAGHEVTVIERASVLRKEGQTVDIRKEGLRVVEWMGIRDEINERTTREAGLRLVDDKGKVWAAFPQSGDGTFTSEVEIVRGELAMLFYEISRSKVKYLFGTTIDHFTETDEGVDVTFKTHTGSDPQKRRFDVVIVAEGLYSRTRARALKEDISQPLRSLDIFSASFSLPANETDTPWADGSVYSARRLVLARPDGFGRTRVALSWMDEGPEARAIAHPSTPTDKQKEYIASCFRDLCSPTVTRFLDGLDASDDLYLAELGQTKAPSWACGRIVLLGDTAFCPSPLSGMGTTATIVGAYVLAAELVRNPTDHRQAFAAYEHQLRPWIENIQRLPPGLVSFAHPSSQMGVIFVYWASYTISILMKLDIFNLLSKFVPIYQALPLPPASLFDRANP